jgi:hypothetical protein
VRSALHQRFKRENVIILGVIAGKHRTDEYVAPLIEELKVLWSSGIRVKLPKGTANIIVRAALGSIVGDVPAVRGL